MSEWISCSDAIPEDDETVLVAYKHFVKQLAYYEKETNLFWPLDSAIYTPLLVTHWLRIPKLSEDMALHE